jgi:histidinol-phosphate/aromatic aminotransferase/cobyric acid decarboxylase-like protein
VDDLVRLVRDRRARALAICNPNNPTGAVLSQAELRNLLDQTRHLEIVVIDESFIDFVSEKDVPTIADEVMKYQNAVVIKSLGKNLGLHGLRCGYAVACRNRAAELRRMLPPWNVNSLAEEFIRILARCSEQYDEARRRVVRDSKAFEKRLSQIEGLSTYPTNANFVYCRLDDGISGTQVRNILLEQSACFIRECGSKIGSNSQFLRIATRPEEQQKRLVRALEQVLAGISGRLSKSTNFPVAGSAQFCA